MDDSPLERQHEKYYLQKVQVINELAGVDRLEVFRRLCEGKRVLHLGCVDHPIFDPQKNLHIQLEKHCAVLDGFDVNVEGFERMRPFVKGTLLSKWEDITEEYDLVLVPEVMEHVPNVQEFLGRIAKIRTARVIITVPDAFQCFRRHFDYNRETNTFVEVVHPDHNCWYTPYTLTNTLKKYTDWAIESVWFVNGISVMAIATVKSRSPESVPVVAPLAAGQPKVLLACDYYWPSHGGVETIAANLGASLGSCGYEVEVAARALPERLENVHRGMVIHSLDANNQTSDGFSPAVRQLRSLIESGRYAAVILMADPLTWVLWSLEGAQVPNQTRVFVQPLINEDGYARWKDNEPFRKRLTELLRPATQVTSLTHKGPDARFLESEHIPFVSIPNATAPESSMTDFRSTYGFEQRRPLVVHVGNLWPVKNQIGLIHSFQSVRLDMQIALIGNPSGDKDYENAVRSEVLNDPRFKLLTGLYGEKVAAAMKAADVVVLSSFGEVFPVSLLEAMSHGKAWLATPQCGAANELAGGIIASLEQFPAIVERLLANRDLLTRLGRLGRLHWEACFQWPRVAQVWSDMIRAGTEPASWGPPQAVWEETTSLRRQILGDDPSSRSSASSAAPKQTGAPYHLTSAPLVSVIMPTHDRPAMLQNALRSILSQTYESFEILVIDDGQTSAAAHVMALDHGGRIRYVWNGQHRERSFSRNEGLQLARGKYIAYLDDDDIFYPDHLATLVGVLEQTGCTVAYTDAYRAYQERVEDGSYVTRGRDLQYSNDFDRDIILVSNLLPICCLMHERACLDRVGLFDEALATHEDWDLLIRLSRHYAPVHIKRVTAEVSWRMDGSTSTSSQQADFKRTRALLFERYASEAQKNPQILLCQRSILEQDGHAQPSAQFTCSIVIPVWNKVELTKQCLTALADVTVDMAYEVIVVDNGSTDQTTELLRSLKGAVQIIRNKENLGFAKACNQGARAARGKYLVFLNNDTVPQVNWLTPLVSEVEKHSKVAVVGSKLLYPDGSIQHAGVVFSRSHRAPYLRYHRAASDLPAVSVRRECQAVAGSCLLIRRGLFEEIGGFDEGFQNGFEDVDLCLKVCEKGYQVVYQPRSVLSHLESHMPGRTLQDTSSAQRLRERWGAHWWLADEDLHYHSDGYRLIGSEAPGESLGGIQPLGDIKERAAWAHVAAAQAAARKKDWVGVKRELGLAHDWPPDPFVLSWAALVCEKLGEPALQQSFLTRYLELKESPDVRVALLRVLLTQKNLAAAEQHLNKLLAGSPHHTEGLLLHGIFCIQREQYREAETSFSLAMEQGADRKKCLMGMGMASLGRAYAQGAWEQFLLVLAEHPDDAEAVHWLLRAGTAQNRWVELSGHLRQYVSRNPGDLAVRFALAGVLVRAERIDEARHEHDALQAVAPEFDGLAELGRVIAGKEMLLAMEGAGMEPGQWERVNGE